MTPLSDAERHADLRFAHIPESERKRIADMIWKCIENVQLGQTDYWTVEQLKHIAREVEPPEYIKRTAA